MLRSAKLFLLAGASALRLNELTFASRWRQQRLLILCYHGIALDDEHEWSPGLFMPIQMFDQRLNWIEEYKCTVMPFTEAIQRLYSGTLPPRAVTLTFDDGFYGFYSLAWPAIRRRGWPVTLYLTTYYCDYNWPVFDPMVPYLLWKSRKSMLEWDEILPDRLHLDSCGRALADQFIKRYCLDHQFSGNQKDNMLSELADRLEIDLPKLSSRRIMRLVNPDEVRELASHGVDIQLHTHIHRVSRNRERFFREIERNQDRIADLSGNMARHFCYPSGFCLPEFPAWLRDFGVLSATTCESGICTRNTDSMRLPRLLDSCGLSKEEFIGWLSGVSSILPKRVRSLEVDERQLLVE